MSKTIKIINISAVFIWVALLALLFYRQQAGTPLGKQQALKGAIEKTTHWYDIYAGSKKIGLANTVIEKVGDEIIIRHEREMKVFKNGKETVLFEKLRCLSDLSFSIKSFEYTSHFKDEKGIKLTGEADAKEVLFFLESSDKRKTHKTPIKGKELYLPITFIHAISQKNPVPGSTFIVPVLDFNSLVIKDLRVSLEDVKPVKIGINIRSLFKFKSGNSVWWSNEKGIIVKEENPTGLIFYMQNENIAKDPSDRILLDYTTVSSIKPDGLIQKPDNLRMLRVRIRGFRLNSELYKNSLVRFNSDILTINKDDAEELKKRTYNLPYNGSDMNNYLKPDEWVLSEDRNVKGNAHNMAVIEKNDAFRMARYLNSNLYFTVSSMPIFSLSNSLDIFKSRLGDHMERSVMFASFARAVGLPTRLVGGLVYLNGYFYFHTWPAVWFDKWVPVDPTLAQFPADATHIPLKEGTLKDIISIVDDLKNIEIEILEAL